MSLVPGAESAWVQRDKILTYLLNMSHAEGGSKARFFLARGFSTANWAVFRDALVAHIREHPFVHRRESHFGAVYRVRCDLLTPDGTNPCVVTVWEVRHETMAPRLITTFPS